MADKISSREGKGRQALGVGGSFDVTTHPDRHRDSRSLRQTPLEGILWKLSELQLK